jgi:hypothetical protein
VPAMELQMTKNRRSVGRLSVVLTLACLLACGGRHSADESKSDGPIKECDEYASRYEACLASRGGEALARRRASATRDALADGVRKGTNRDELRKTCVAGLAQLHCP